MIIKQHADLSKDMKDLRKFNTPMESLDSWVRLFNNYGLGMTAGIERYPSMFPGHEIYKARVIPLKENCGKSKGYRLIFEMKDGCCTLLVYSRHGIYSDESELIGIIRYRLSTLCDTTCVDFCYSNP